MHPVSPALIEKNTALDRTDAILREEPTGTEPVFPQQSSPDLDSVSDGRRSKPAASQGIVGESTDRESAQRNATAANEFGFAVKV